MKMSKLASSVLRSPRASGAKFVDNLKQICFCMDRMTECHLLEAPTRKFGSPLSTHSSKIVSKFDIGNIFALVGENFFGPDSLDMFVDFLNEKVQGTHRTILMTTDMDKVLCDTSDLSSLRYSVKDFTEL